MVQFRALSRQQQTVSESVERVGGTVHAGGARRQIHTVNTASAIDRQMRCDAVSAPDPMWVGVRVAWFVQPSV